MKPWMCDGIPKNGKVYPTASADGHEPYENTGPDCLICGLPQEAMEQSSTQAKTKVPSSGKTVMTGGKTSWLLPAILGVALLGLVGGFAAFFLLRSNETVITDNNTQNSTQSSSPFVSGRATNPALFSQGEKILLDVTPDKQAGASAFSQEDWDGAIAAYQQAATQNPNDPEGKIYLNNAKARKSGSPLTLSVVVPITPSPDSSKEILRGVARYQEEFNQGGGSGQLAIVIANAADALKGASLAQDIIDSPEILGVLGHGADPGSQQALRRYQDAQIAALSPLTTSVSTEGQPILKIIPIDQKSDELLGNYLQAVGKTLANQAKKQGASSAVIFYNSDSPYSQQLKQSLQDATQTMGVKVTKQIDVSAGNFNPNSAINQEKVGFLALSKNKVPQAIAIAQANQNAGSPMRLMGGDELYNPDTLIQGGDAINGLILAVPWRFQPNDPFAQDAVQSWKGRVSWRTATAYDATQVMADTAHKTPNRSGIYQALNQGVSLKTKTTDFGIFNEVPLVEAISGKNGPPGSQYQFSPLQ